MKKYYLFLILAIALLSLFPCNSIAENKTDLKIITYLDTGGFMTPALSKNNTFIYNNIEFNLYSDEKNTTYLIIINNITIANRNIEDFKSVFLYNCNYDYIYKLEIIIGNDYYNYSGIFVFTTSITNDSILDKEPYLKFTKIEYQNLINELKLKLFSADGVGWFTAMIISYISIKERKKSIIEEIN